MRGRGAGIDSPAPRPGRGSSRRDSSVFSASGALSMAIPFAGPLRPLLRPHGGAPAPDRAIVRRPSAPPRSTRPRLEALDPRVLLSAAAPAPIRIDAISAAQTPGTPSGGLDPASDTGISATDNVTNDVDPTFIGRAVPGSTVIVTVVRDNPVIPVLVPFTIGQTTTGPDG